jgi:hypothetical protein
MDVAETEFCAPTDLYRPHNIGHLPDFAKAPKHGADASQDLFSDADQSGR